MENTGLTWGGLDVLHPVLDGQLLPHGRLHLPVPHQVRLVGHQDDGLVGHAVGGPQAGEEPVGLEGGGGEGAHHVQGGQVVHGEHHQEGVGLVGGGELLKGQGAVLQVDEHDPPLLPVDGHHHLLLDTVLWGGSRA